MGGEGGEFGGGGGGAPLRLFVGCIFRRERKVILPGTKDISPSILFGSLCMFLRPCIKKSPINLIKMESFVISRFFCFYQTVWCHRKFL